MHKIRLFQILVIVNLGLYLAACSNAKALKDSSAGIESTDAEPGASKQISNVSKVLNADDEDAISLTHGLKDVTLIAVEKSEDESGILGVNIKEESNHVLLCKDQVYDIVYYVNYGMDYFIYRLKNGKSELAVAMPAKRLFSVGGKLYFMLETYDTYVLDGLKNGNIFCYDPITGEVTMISDAEATTMYVYDDGIYYKVETIYEDYDNGTWSANTDLYYYSFASSKIEAINSEYITLYKWKDYYISYEMEELDEGDELYRIYGNKEKIYKTVGLKLETLDKSKSIELAVDPHIRDYTIVNNSLYNISDSKTLIIYNIETKEKTEIPLAIHCVNDFTILNGMIYLDNLLQVNMETGAQSFIYAEDASEVIYELYTDGESLYGVCGSSGGIGYGVMKHIILEETTDETIIMENESGIKYEVNHLKYHTLPMGEE